MASTTKNYTIPLRSSFQKSTPKKRAPKALRALKEFVRKHCKVEEVKIGPVLNEEIWARGITNPPAKVRVGIVVDNDVAKVEVQGVVYAEPVKPEEKPKNLRDKLMAKVGGSKKESEQPQQEVVSEEQQEQPANTKQPAQETVPAKKKVAPKKTASLETKKE